MKIKYILLVALAALAFSLAAIEVTAPAIAGGRVGGGGDLHARLDGRLLIAPETLIAGGRGDIGGEF